jgi:hypothetical protein
MIHELFTPLKSLVLLILLGGIAVSAFSQVDDWLLPDCRKVTCSGKRIASDLGFFELCVPRNARVKKEWGEHGDLHYTITLKSRGREYSLDFTSGLYFPGRDPSNGDPRWSVRAWRHTDAKGETRGKDYRFADRGRYSRYITLNVLMGYATYKDAPAEVAVRFEGILDSLCWGECKVCGAQGTNSERRQ